MKFYGLRAGAGQSVFLLRPGALQPRGVMPA